MIFGSVCGKENASKELAKLVHFFKNKKNNKKNKIFNMPCCWYLNTLPAFFSLHKKKKT
jgi:hypothetical protein